MPLRRVCGTEVTQPPSPQCLRIRLCQLRGRCHRKQEQGQRLERGVTHQKDAGSGEMSSVRWAGWGWGESRGCCRLHNITPQCECMRARVCTHTHTHTHTHTPLTHFSLVAWCCCSVAKSYLTLCDPMDCSTPGFPVLPHLPGFAQVHVHPVADAIHPSHPLSSPSPPTFSLSQHQGLF